MKFSLNFSPKLLLLGAAGITLLYSSTVSAQVADEETTTAVAEDIVTEDNAEQSADTLTPEDVNAAPAQAEVTEVTEEIIEEEVTAIEEVPSEEAADTAAEETEPLAEDPAQPKAIETETSAPAPAENERKRWWERPY